MQCLGIRCSNSDYSIVILSGNRGSPKIIKKACNCSPNGYTTARRLKWFLQELEDILNTFEIDEIVIKGTEPMAQKGGTYAERVENEAMIFLAAEKKGIKSVVKKVNSTIAKDHGLKGRGKYLATLDFSIFPDFEKEKQKMQEAITIAWTCFR